MAGGQESRRWWPWLLFELSRVLFQSCTFFGGQGAVRSVQEQFENKRVVTEMGQLIWNQRFMHRAISIDGFQFEHDSSKVPWKRFRHHFFHSLREGVDLLHLHMGYHRNLCLAWSRQDARPKDTVCKPWTQSDTRASNWTVCDWECGQYIPRMVC